MSSDTEIPKKCFCQRQSTYSIIYGFDIERGNIKDEIWKFSLKTFLDAVERYRTIQFRIN